MALKYPLGAPHNVAGMEAGAVCLQPVEMEPNGHMRKMAKPDVHFKADIHDHARFTVCVPDVPENTMQMHFGRHTDHATGARPWFRPMVLEWSHTCAGVGKKGRY